MPHASGNPTWQDYPSTATPITALSLEQIEAAIDNAPRAPRPVVEANLTADYPTLAGNTYLGMRGQMTATTDTHGMWAGPGNGTSLYTMTVPAGWAGRWEIFWLAYADGITGSLMTVSFINAPVGTGNGAGLGQYTWLRGVITYGNGLLAVGDTISLGVYAFQSGTWNMRAILGGGPQAKTKVVFRWVGPN